MIISSQVPHPLTPNIHILIFQFHITSAYSCCRSDTIAVVYKMLPNTRNKYGFRNFKDTVEYTIEKKPKEVIVRAQQM